MELTVNDKVYQVIKLLGKGKGGYSYLVTDEKAEYVLKQIHHEPCTYYQFRNKLEAELKDYMTLKKIGIPMPELIEVDVKQERLLKQYIKGDTIDQLVLKNQMKSAYLNQVRRMAQGLYEAFLNIDYYPTNFVVQGDKLWYIDYECNLYMKEWNFENWGLKYWSKTPEFMAKFKQNKAI